MKRKILVNSTAGVVQVAVNIIVTFLSIPIYYAYLGGEMYGVYSVITAVGIIGNFINFGFNISIIKFLSEQGRCAESDRDIFTAVTLAGGLVSMVVMGGIVFRHEVLADVLRIPSQLQTADVYGFYTAVLISNIFMFLGEIPSAVLDSQHKIYITNVLQMVNIVLNRGGGAVAVMLGAGIAGVGQMYLAASLSWFALLLFYFFRHWEFTSFRGLLYRFPASVKKQVAYGYKVLLTGISGFFYEPFMKVLISRYIGIAEVGMFDIAFRLKNIVWNVMVKALYPITPLIARYTDAAAVRMLVDRVSRMLLMVSLPLIAMLLSMTDEIIGLWLGEGQEMIIRSTKIIIGAHLVLISSIPAYQYLQIKDHPEKNFYIQLLNAILSFTYFMIMVPHWGYIAAVIAFVSAVLTTNALMIFFQWKYLDSIIFLPVRPLLLSALIAIGIYAVNLVVQASIGDPPLLRLAVMAALDGIAVPVALVRFGVISMTDIRWLTSARIGPDIV
ncbi:MAG: oligosaccharide flippase family protein [Bacteroidetes bacterium]|nr:oligosaccharide flippase family protein [Bacteroidota bacterium]